VSVRSRFQQDVVDARPRPVQLPRPWRSAQIETLRPQLFKIGARVRQTARCIRFHLRVLRHYCLEGKTLWKVHDQDAWLRKVPTPKRAERKQNDVMMLPARAGYRPANRPGSITRLMCRGFSLGSPESRTRPYCVGSWGFRALCR
jgi:hypothetical protein